MGCNGNTMEFLGIRWDTAYDSFNMAYTLENDRKLWFMVDITN